MSQQQETQLPPSAFGAESYSIADPAAQRTYVESRVAAKWVGFFLPHLRSGMSVLDVGCGVGSITLDLAAIVVPGQVIGIDVDASQVDVARSLAVERGVTNVCFEVASIHELPFPDASFDAALAHTLLVHLRDPLRALKAIRRVLKPDGVIAVSDDDFSTFVVSPSSPLADQLLDLWVRVLEYNGGSPYYSRHLRHLLLEAGFTRTEGHAVAAEYHGKLEETRRFAGIAEQLLRHPAIAGLVVGQGWASRDEVEAIGEWIRTWAERPDAFIAWMYCAAVGWAEDAL